MYTHPSTYIIFGSSLGIIEFFRSCSSMPLSNAIIAKSTSYTPHHVECSLVRKYRKAYLSRAFNLRTHISDQNFVSTDRIVDAMFLSLCSPARRLQRARGLTKG